ncbi:hypothetical protein CYLTODRAFT_162330 [Cylindrobasidium torrendii FP15055 ss-10]|uniref:Uncharacterized protein n=1 Tax=Cylindrobasidium torrendii FP15055 ss-10 TaxID=1314674 RepID=A0A0D7B010_9AGAR|nr:hypothetical protein CYLTODRAFT_162330 [Cylindrobasidium torrendii FP15055 ss-10]
MASSCAMMTPLARRSLQKSILAMHPGILNVLPGQPVELCVDRRVDQDHVPQRAQVASCVPETDSVRLFRRLRPHRILNLLQHLRGDRPFCAITDKVRGRPESADDKCTSVTSGLNKDSMQDESVAYSGGYQELSQCIHSSVRALPRFLFFISNSSCTFWGYLVAHGQRTARGSTPLARRSLIRRSRTGECQAAEQRNVGRNGRDWTLLLPQKYEHRIHLHQTHAMIEKAVAGYTCSRFRQQGRRLYPGCRGFKQVTILSI